MLNYEFSLYFCPQFGPLVSCGHFFEINSMKITFLFSKLFYKSFPLFVLFWLFLPPAFAHASTLNIWWPADSATVTGTQPFKAVVDNAAPSSYNMYWQVDGGALSLMDTNTTGYPHKESVVDLSGWSWNPSNTYKITFVAKDLNGNNMGQASVSININNNQPVPPPVSILPPVQNNTIEVWWPTAQATLSGVQPAKAILKNQPLSNYKMYWSIGGGPKTELIDNLTDGAHKEISIDFTNWRWKGNGPYDLEFTAVDFQNNTLATNIVPVFVNSATPNPPQSAPPSSSPPTTIFGTASLYINKNSPALAQAALWKYSRPTDSKIMQKIGNQSSAVWFGDWNTDVTLDVQKLVLDAENTNSVPTLVVYNIPGRDCSGYSAGGAATESSYLNWINKFSTGLGQRKAIVILEPDALSNIDCLSQVDQDSRYRMLSGAVSILKNNSQTKVYLDAGHSRWIDADTMSRRLFKAGVQNVSGFSLNVSNFFLTSEIISYGNSLSQKTGNSHYVIDTSRNGAGSNGEWCNPLGRAVGAAPTLSTGEPLVDAYLWIKPVGESDGYCNGGPAAGVWWPEYILDMAKLGGY